MEVNFFLDKIMEFLPNNILIKGLFLYGSQLYGLDTEESDFDWFCIIDKNFQHKVRFDFGEVFFYTIEQFNTKFERNLEKTFDILYTPFYYLAKDFEDEWNQNSQILKSKITPQKIKSMLRNKILEHYDYLFWMIGLVPEPIPTWYNKKRLYRLLIRLEQWHKVEQHFPPEKIFLGTNYRDFFLKVKTIPNFVTRAQMKIIINEVRKIVLPEKEK